jgi:hypothetical protein
VVNRDIRGQGWWKLEAQDFRLRILDAGVVKQIRALNARFIDDQFGPGILITESSHSDGALIQLSGGDRRKDAVLPVTVDNHAARLAVSGTYPTRPAPGHRLTLFVRRRTLYYSQHPIDFNPDPDYRKWRCDSLRVSADAEGVHNGILIADLSKDLLVSTRRFAHVNVELKGKVRLDTSAWVGIDMEPAPRGLKKLALLRVKASTQHQPRHS